MISTGPNRNSLWATILVEEFVRLGCHTFFISPGLRSSPITTAIGRHGRTRSIVHFDERGGAFAALGYGRTSNRPAVWVTTSGTALANGYPAVVEASVDAVPLILITADRPPELRDTGANQTIQQQRFFGDLVRWFVDMPTPTPEIDPSFVLTTVDQAVYRAVANRGPVHVNCMFRDPLSPETEAHIRPESSAGFDRWSDSNAPFTTYVPVSRKTELDAVDSHFGSAKRPLCILGRLADASMAEGVVRWAAAGGIPVFPDITSGMRLGAATKSLIPYYDLLLSADSSRSRGIPDAIFQVGRISVSKRLKQLIADTAPFPHIVALDGAERIDQDHNVTHRYELGKDSLLALLSDARMRPEVEEGWLEGWTDDNQKTGDWLSEQFSNSSAENWSEQALAYHLSDLLPEDHILMLASSLSIRHVNTFGVAGRNRVSVMANRGASGIDGTIATAAGCAIATGKKATVLLGDQALLHDLNSLHLAVKTGMTVIVMNNDGGGIFSYLPIGKHADVFETYFASPHGLSFHHAAGLFRCSYACPTTLTEFATAYSEAMVSDGPTLIELKTDRKRTHEQYLDLLSGISEHLS